MLAIFVCLGSPLLLVWVRDSVGRWRKVVCPKADAQNGVCTNEGLSTKASVFVGTSVDGFIA